MNIRPPSNYRFTYAPVCENAALHSMRPYIGNIMKEIILCFCSTALIRLTGPDSISNCKANAPKCYPEIARQVLTVLVKPQLRLKKIKLPMTCKHFSFKVLNVKEVALRGN